MLQRSWKRALFGSVVLVFTLALAACNMSHRTLPPAAFGSSYARGATGQLGSEAISEEKDCASTASAAAPYFVQPGSVPSRCALLSALASGQPAVFTGVDIPHAQALLALAEGQPASEVVVPFGEADNAPLHYVVVQRSQTGPPLLLESVGTPLSNVIAQARADVEQPAAKGTIGDAWFPVLRSELRVSPYAIDFEKTFEATNWCLFCLPPGDRTIRCPSKVDVSTGAVTYHHNVYRLISAYRPDDFYLADAWAVRPNSTDFTSNYPLLARINAPFSPICESAARINMGLLNHWLNMEEPLAIDARMHDTVGNLYEWAPETRPKKWEYRLYLGADALFAKKGFPVPGLSASYEITWTVDEFSVKPRINGFVATDGEFNTDYVYDVWDRMPKFYDPARGPFQATSSYEQGFTTKIPSPKAPEIYQHLIFPYKAVYEQLAGINCAAPPFFRVSMSTCDPRKDFGLNVDSRPLVSDPVLGFQAAPNDPYKYKLDDVCVVQRDHGVNPITTLRLISQQFSPATPIPVQFSNSGGGHIDPDFVAIEPVLDEKTFVIHVRLNAGKKAIINDRRTFDVETKPPHISPSTRYNPVRFTVTIRAHCP